MPGVFGILGQCQSAVRESAFDKMADAMTIEPFYSLGRWSSDKFPAVIGWTAHSGSYSDCAPIWNESKDIFLATAGEHFCREEDIDYFRKKGLPESASEKASSLIHLYEEFGNRFFSKINGPLSGVLIDLRRRKAVLFNDRLGLARIYCHQTRNELYFSSEAKALLATLPKCRELDQRGFGEYISNGSPLQNRTLFNGISTMPPSSNWEFDQGGKVSKSIYFDISTWENLPRLPEEEYFEKLKSTFQRVVPRYFSGSQEVSMSITGGLDSRMVISGVSPSMRRLKCYSHTGMYRKCADARIGKRIAEACGFSHQDILVDKGFFKAFPELVRDTIRYSDGAMDAIGAAGLYANRKARDIAPVRLTGNYGGEVLRGVSAFRAGNSLPLEFDSALNESLQLAYATFAEEKSDCVNFASFIAFRQVPWHHYARFAMESSQLTVRSPFLDIDLLPLSYQMPDSLEANQLLNLRLINECKPGLAKIPTDRGTRKRPSFIPQKFWYYYKEFLPLAEYTYDYGMPNWMAKTDTILSPLQLDRLFLGNQKYAHYRKWYRNELASFLKETLLDKSVTGLPYLDKSKVEKIVLDHTSGRGNYTLNIHRLLSLTFIEKELLKR